jgi:hypothetical protein
LGNLSSIKSNACNWRLWHLTITALVQNALITEGSLYGNIGGLNGKPAVKINNGNFLPLYNQHKPVALFRWVYFLSTRKISMTKTLSKIKLFGFLFGY